MAKLSNLETIEKPKGIFRIFWFIIKLSWRSNKWVFSGAVVTTLIIVSFNFLNSYSFAQILNILVSPDPTWKKIIPYLVIIVLLDYIPAILNPLQQSLTDFIDRVLRIDLEQLVYKKISNLDIATIEQPDFQDMLYQINSRGIAGMININFWLFTLIKDGFKVVFALVILFTLSKIGLLVLILSTIPVYFYESWRAKRLGKIFALQTETNRKAGSRVEAFNNKDALIEVKFFGLGNYFLEKIKGIRTAHHTTLSKDDRKMIPMYAGSQLFPSVGILVSIVGVIGDVIKGTRSIGTLSFVWGTLWSFSGGFASILRSVGRLEEHGTYASKLMNMLEMRSYVSENKDGIQYNIKIPPTIEFKNVSFAYPGSDRIVLSNVNTVISANSETALVGLNGAGKTTLLRLLSRVYDPTEGQILVNGVDLRDYSLESWRNALGIMLQDYRVYQDESIKENITFAQGKENKARLKVVSKETGVDEYAGSYADGLDQMIGKEYRGGVELSKGQKQKLVIARTLYQNHPFLILDEPTAAIDALSEDYIFKALRNNHTNQTRVIISHKFSNVRDADKIILIKNGTVLEQGNHVELMEFGGTYKELFELQAEGYRE